MIRVPSNGTNRVPSLAGDRNCPWPPFQNKPRLLGVRFFSLGLPVKTAKPRRSSSKKKKTGTSRVARAGYGIRAALPQLRGLEEGQLPRGLPGAVLAGAQAERLGESVGMARSKLVAAAQAACAMERPEPSLALSFKTPGSLPHSRRTSQQA